jgi:ABC-2 type transport system ATP-binding protein
LDHEQNTILDVTGLKVQYGSFVAVKGANFCMKRGACGLLGRNGAGKSSIIRAILGLVPPKEGGVKVLGLDARRQGLLVRDKIGYMPEKEAIFPGLSGVEAVSFAGRLSGLPPLAAKQRAHEVLFLVGLAEERYRPVGGYSAGMKQRIKLAQALIHDPDLLFLDEPTNGLDPEGRTEILGLLRNLVEKKGKSLLLCSHILPDVEGLCENVILLDEGQVLRQGAIHEMLSSLGSLYRLRYVGGEGLDQQLENQGLIQERQKDGELLIKLPPKQKVSYLFSMASQLGAQIRLLEPEKRSLLDIFLEAVQKSGQLPKKEEVHGAH